LQQHIVSIIGLREVIIAIKKLMGLTVEKTYLAGHGKKLDPLIDNIHI